MLKVRSIFNCLEYAGALPALPIRRSLFLFFAVFCFAAFAASASARTVSPQADGRNAETVPFSSIREAYRQKAFDLWKRAADLQIGGWYEEALEKYREGLGYHEDPRVREHVWKLEETLAARRGSENARKQAARRAAAPATWSRRCRSCAASPSAPASPPSGATCCISRGATASAPPCWPTPPAASRSSRS